MLTVRDILHNQCSVCAQFDLLGVVGFDGWREQHVAADQALRGGKLLSTLRAKLAVDTVTHPEGTSTAHDTPSGADGVVSEVVQWTIARSGYMDAEQYLHSAGQGGLLDECKNAHAALEATASAYHILLARHVDVLLAYQTIAREYPRDMVVQNRICIWREWVRQLLQGPDTGLCRMILTSTLFTPIAPASVSCVRAWSED